MTRRAPLRLALVLLAALAVAAAGLWWADRIPPLEETPSPAAGAGSTQHTAETPAEQVERGRLLALAGNCAGCHTARGGTAYAGGRAIPTPFGTVVAGNLTPDAATGLGHWSAAQFWRALHHGIGADGRRLVPAFPYTEFTRITRADSDALFAYLRSLPAVARANPAPALRWPFGTPLALAAWRTLYFRPGVQAVDATQSAEWNRGAYLVQGLGHCGACHVARNALGGPKGPALGGGPMPASGALAPSLHRTDEAGVQHWPQEEVVAFLRTGRSAGGWAQGAMAEVVAGSTQHLPPADLQAMATYLRSLPVHPAAARPDFKPDALRAEQGGRLYEEHCAGCHGKRGQGGQTTSGTVVAPALAGNRLVTMEPPANLVRAIALGGFGAATAAHPRPFGMAPYAHVLNDDELGAVATFLRANWGAQAAPVSAHEVARWRAGAAH